MENNAINGSVHVKSAKTPQNSAVNPQASDPAAPEKVARATTVKQEQSEKDVANRADGSTPQEAGADRVKVLPPLAPVDVPRQPAKPTASTPDEAARDTRRQVEDETESNWADGAAPQPRAKNARSSIL